MAGIELRRQRDGPRSTRPSRVLADKGPVAHRRRNVVERRFNRLTQFRAIATRYDKTALSSRAMIDLATRTLRP